jgi:hypothetical protein
MRDSDLVLLYGIELKTSALSKDEGWGRAKLRAETSF